MKRTFGLAFVAAVLGSFALPAWAEDTTSEARGLVDRAEYSEALKLIERITDPEDAALLRAEVLFRTGKLAEAEKQAAKAEKDERRKLDAAILRGEIQAAQGQLSEAEKTFRSIEAEPLARRARLRLGELLIQTGRRKDARKVLLTLIADYNSDAISASDALGLSYVGRALHLLRNAREANQAFSEAEKAAGKKPPLELLLWTAELFLDKYNEKDGGRAVQTALELAPTDPRVLSLSARMMSEHDFGAAAEEVAKALAVNPSLPTAHYLAAGLALRDLDIEAADKALQRGLSANPNDLELLSMQAATRFLADDKEGFTRLETAVLKLNPEYSQFYRIVGEYAEWEHRYDDIVAFMEKALTVDPADGQALAQLGLNLIRGGREQEGVAALDKAFAKDPFNVRAFNTLNLYEKTIPVEYETVDGPTFRIRYAKNERAILERYVPQFLDEAWGSMVKRYKFTPTMPISVEFYADEEHFSVRTSGLPNVGIQGVCFGKSLALMSPAAAPFNWGNILWHELGHVFAIQQSKAHVPRWFTEGLSEYETIARRKEWQREEDRSLFKGLEEKRVPSVAGFNRAFTHVDSADEVVMAYYAASQIVVFMVERFGWEKTVSTLELWGKGQRTPEVIRAALGVEASKLDAEYRAWLDQRYTRYKTQFTPNPDSPSVQKAEEALRAEPKNVRKLVELALAKAKAGKDDEARKLFEEALTVDPKNGDALYFLADISLDQEGVPEAERAKKALGYLDQLLAAGVNGYAVQMKRARILDVAGDGDGARLALDEASKLDPVQSEPHMERAKMEAKAKDAKAELTALKSYTQLEQHDRSGYLRLLELLVERQRWEEAREVAESAIFVDVANPELHRLYARTLANLGKRVQAVYEYNSALISGAPPEMAVGIYSELAKGYEQMKQPEFAKKALEYRERVQKRVKTELASTR